MAELYAEQAATARTAAPTIAIVASEEQGSLPRELTEGLTGLTDGQRVVVIVPATREGHSDAPCADGGAAAPELVRITCS
jgi:hypothetical protein